MTVLVLLLIIAILLVLVALLVCAGCVEISSMATSNSMSLYDGRRWVTFEHVDGRQVAVTFGRFYGEFFVGRWHST